MGLFNKKKDQSEGFSVPTGEMGPPPGMPQGTPKDSVLQMRQQGMSNYQIIQDLQNQGYNFIRGCIKEYNKPDYYSGQINKICPY